MTWCVWHKKLGLDILLKQRACKLVNVLSMVRVLPVQSELEQSLSVTEP